MSQSGSPQQRVLVFSAHAADWCSRGGATIAKYVQAGAQVRVVCLTYGERGEAGDLWRAAPDTSLAEAKAIRRAEAQAAADILGVELEFLDWDDYPLYVDKDRLLVLIDKIREVRPQLLLTHWTNDPLNQDHQETSAAVIRACSCAAAQGQHTAHPPTRWPVVYLYEATVPLSEFEGFNPDTYVDVTATFDAKLEALRQFKAQSQLPGWYTIYGEKRAFQARSLTGRTDIKYAEAFKCYRPRVADWLE